MSRKSKKHMRRTRHLKRCKKRRDRKSNTEHKDRSYYINKKRNELIKLRSDDNRVRYMPKDEMPWLDTIL